METAPKIDKSFKSGFVAIIGRPNVGKSTLINRLTGRKISIISPKPQTTRNRIIGVLNLNNAQIVFLDTPGIFRPRRALDKKMVRTAYSAVSDSVLFVTDGDGRFEEKDRIILERLKDNTVFLLVNKIDRIKRAELLPIIARYDNFFPFKEVIPISALKGENIEAIPKKITESLSPGPRYFPEGKVTDQPEKFIAAEIVREKLFMRTHQEIPYSLTVEIENASEEKGLLRLEAVIYVESPSQRKIVIGKSGALLKEIGTQARKELEHLFGLRVYLGLWVKVKKDWRQDEKFLSRMGF
jgi:GTP-binding protein Era